MKHLLLHNWKIKLTCLVLAFVVWFVIKHNVDPSGEAFRRSGETERGKK